MAQCQRLGAKVVVACRGDMTTIRIEHEREEMVEACRRQLASATAFDVFTEDGKDLLFLPPGERQMKEAQRTTRAYIHWDKASRTVRIFGRQSERQNAIAFLSQAVKDLARLHHGDFALQNKAVKAIRQNRGLQALSQQTGLAEADIRLLGNTLSAWGDAEKVQALQKLVEERGWVRKVQPMRRAANELCGLCMCEFDESVFRPSVLHSVLEERLRESGQLQVPRVLPAAHGRRRHVQARLGLAGHGGLLPS